MRGSGPPLVLLVLLSAVSPLATDLYTPAFPSMAPALGASEAAVQVTFSAFIIGMGLGQLVIGPISDGIGRRPFLIAGSISFVAFSLLCAMAESVWILVLWRLLQGVAGAACIAMARATISDVYSPALAAKRFGTVAAIQSIAPVIAPVLGSLILLVGDWRLVFLAIAVVGMVTVVGTLVRMPESLPAEQRSGTRLADNVHRMRSLLRHRTFMGYVITSCLACAGFFTYIAGAPLVMHAVFDFSEQQYGLFFAVNAFGMAGSISLLRVLGRRVAHERLLLAGLLVAVASGGMLLAASLTGLATLPVVWTCILCLTMSVGFINPSGLILSQRAGRVFAGTAAALHGGLQFTSGALASPATGLLGPTSIVPMASLIFAFMALALISNRVGARRLRGRPNDGLRGTMDE